MARPPPGGNRLTMRISLLLPCYNAAPYVGAAIAAALAQNRPADEIIAVDDGSTDATPAILRRLAPAVTLVAQANQGIAGALNTALAHASGDAIAFLDADDLCAPQKLSVLAAALRGTPALDAVFGHMVNFQDRRGAPHDVTEAAPSVPGIFKGTMLIRRSAVDRIGHFDVTRRHADFLDWYARATQRGFRWAMLPEVVYWRRIHDHNMGRLAKPQQSAEYLLAMKDFLNRRRA